MLQKGKAVHTYFTVPDPSWQLGGSMLSQLAAVIPVSNCSCCWVTGMACKKYCQNNSKKVKC